jgi:hypothetical protein
VEAKREALLDNTPMVNLPEAIGQVLFRSESFGYGQLWIVLNEGVSGLFDPQIVVLLFASAARVVSLGSRASSLLNRPVG